MKLGYFMMPVHHPSKDYHRALAEDIEAIVHADRASLQCGSGATGGA